MFVILMVFVLQYAVPVLILNLCKWNFKERNRVGADHTF